MSATPTPQEIARELTKSRRAALLTRDEQGEYSSAVFKHLLAAELVDYNYRFTPLGLAVRAALTDGDTNG
jgi:hypothetical protein